MDTRPLHPQTGPQGSMLLGGKLMKAVGPEDMPGVPRPAATRG